MLEIILIFCVIVLILTFFYKQAVCEFRINQIEWSQKDKLHGLLQEKIPLVVRGLPPATFWTHDDINARPCYGNIPIFQDLELSDWIKTSTPNTNCPWDYTQAEIIAAPSGLPIWANKWLNNLMIKSLMKFWIRPSYHCWAGNVGLRKTIATWTCLFPVDGEITVSIMPENIESALPKPWKGCFPSQLTARDTPFIGDLKFIDIILRPGNCIIMPAHWFWSWSSCDTNVATPLTCTISYHSPVSALAFKLTPLK